MLVISFFYFRKGILQMTNEAAVGCCQDIIATIVPLGIRCYTGDC